MATRVKMNYNPYLCKINLYLLNKKGLEEKLTGEVADKIDEHFSNRFCLEDDGEVLLDILSHGFRGSQISIEFVGTNENYLFFKKMCSKRNIALTKSTKQRILSCEEISQSIKDKVEQLKDSGYDIDSNGEISKILDATIPVVVVGNMSAGKSTLLNALIGEELLPSGQNRTTGVNCALHNSRSKVRVEYSINGSTVAIDCKNLDQSKNCKLIPSDLFSMLEREVKPINRVRCVIEYFNYKDNGGHVDRSSSIDRKMMSIYCPFYNKEIPEQIVFFDTPGSDSDVFKDDAKTLETALKEQVKGFLIFVCAERKDLDKSQKLIDTVQDATNNKLDLAHTIVVCNCTEEEPDISMSTSAEKEWASRIIYTSAAVALGARKPEKNSKASWKETKLFSVYKKNSSAFSEPDDDCYLSLPQYSSLPNSRTEGIKKKQNELEQEASIATDPDQAENKLMQFNSGITILEQEIIYVAKELFPYNQCERARKVFLDLLEDYKNKIDQKKREKNTKRKARIDEFNSLYGPLCDALSDDTDKFVVKIKQDFFNRCNTSDYRWSQEKAGDFANHAADQFLNNKYYSEHDEETIRNNIAALLDKDILNYTKRAEQDFNEFLEDSVLPEYAEICKKQINSQSNLKDSEKQVFSSFFTPQRLSDQTKKERKEAIANVKLDIPKLKEQLSGDKWYIAFFKAVVNTGRKVEYWFQKNVGSIKDGLAQYHERAYTENSENILAQIDDIIDEIFKHIKEAFSDESADNNVICNLYPELKDIKNSILELNEDITKLDNKQRRIEDELNLLNNVFSNV